MDIMEQKDMENKLDFNKAVIVKKGNNLWGVVELRPLFNLVGLISYSHQNFIHLFLLSG